MGKRKLLALALAAFTVASSVAGCGSNSNEKTSVQSSAGGENTGDETGKDTSVSADNGEKIKITASVWDSEATPQFKAVSERFMELNPNIEIELIDTQADEYNNKLTVMLSGGDSDPDVIFVKDAESQTTMKNKNQLLALDAFVEKDGLDLSVYKGTAEQLMLDGSYYSLPFRQDWYVLYYNKDIFDQAGIDYPADDMTWDQYEELARKVTNGEGGNKVFGSHNHTWMGLVSNWAVQDGKNTLMSEDYSFLKPYYEQALRMQDDGIIQSYANLKTGSIHYVSVFEQQQCAMLPMGSWFLGTLVQDQKDGKFDFNWGITRIPHPAGLKAGSTVGSVTPVAINAKTDQPEAAWQFVKFASGEEGAVALAEKGIFPAITSDAVIEKLSAIDGFPEGGEIALEVENLVFDRPIDPKMAAVRKVLEEEHDLIMIGEEEIDNGLATMKERAKEAREE